MNLQTFFEKFDLFADAPDAVTKMRELVLLWSVRGRLSEQNVAETCTEQKTRARTFSFKNRREFLSPIDDAPFDVPSNWGWVAVGNAMNLVNGTAFKPVNWTPKGTPIVRIQNLNNEEAPFNRFDGEIDPKFYIDSGDFLISWSGTPGTSFGAFIWKRGRAILNQHIFRCELAENVFIKEYLRLAVNARLDEMISRAHGAVGLQHITKGKLESISLPLPPLAEQKRIVAKVDELMALCDRLEAQQQEREEKMDALARASLARFADAPTPANLNLIFHKSFDITPADLRKSILTLAVQGKLVPQDPNDEPVKDSFPTLAEERVESDNDEFPACWLRVPLGKLGEWRGGGTPSKSHPEFWKGTLPWVSPKDMKVLHISDAQDHISPAAVEGSSVKLIPPGSLLMVVRGMILARAFPVALTMSAVTINQDMKALVPFEPKTKDYLLTALCAFEPIILDSIEHSSHGTCKLKTAFLQSFVMPLPPLAEQHRIVAKVNELMSLVDELEAQMAASRAAGDKLLSALVAELTA
ncbi:MAG TPA: restriction endonuclease subunit S [bacterium]|nr:restriction endonuclease subunit S [bacterium]